MPLIFQGEEWGASTPFPFFCDRGDPELARATRDGRREEFAACGCQPEEIPDPQDPETFASARLCWDELESEPHASLLAWYRRLIALRRAEPDLTDGRLDRCAARFDAERGWLTLRRGGVLIAGNFGAAAQRVPLERPVLEGASAMLAAAGEVRVGAEDPHGVTLGPDAVVILRA